MTIVYIPLQLTRSSYQINFGNTSTVLTSIRSLFNIPVTAGKGALFLVTELHFN